MDNLKNLKIGQKAIKMNNVDDAMSLLILTLDDVLEVSLTENFYELTYYKFLYNNQIQKN